MSWSAPMTAVANTAFTAAQFNQYVRDNLNETAAAKATASDQHFVATGPNAIAARLGTSATVDTPETTTSVSYANLATIGPAVTVTSGTRALVAIYSYVACNTANQQGYATFTISGSFTSGANDNRALSFAGPTVVPAMTAGATFLITGITPGSSTYQMIYRTSAGTSTFDHRRIAVIPF